jgi:hypothetical protein
MLELRLLADDGTGRALDTYTLGQGVSIIGRGEDAQVSIDSSSLSRHHASITITERGAVVSDLGSTNGVFVNQQRVSSQPVQDGDRIHLGPMEFEIRWGAGRSAGTILVESGPAPQVVAPPVQAPPTHTGPAQSASFQHAATLPGPAPAPAPAESSGGGAGKVVIILVLLGLLGGGGYFGWSWWASNNATSQLAATVDEKKQVENADAPKEKDKLVPDAVKVPAEYVAKAAAVAAQGMNMKTPDGVILRIEKNVLNKDTTVKIAKKNPGDEHRVTIYDIDLGGATLTEAAKLTLPIEHPDDVESAEQVRISQPDDEGNWHRLEGTLSEDKRSITVHPTHFSEVKKEEPTTWAQYWWKVDRTTPKLLQVPYESQEETMWCWAASASMIMGAHGTMVSARDIAADNEVGTEKGSIGEGKLKRYMKQRGFDVEYKWWWSETSLAGYIAYQIDQGVPVWLGLRPIGHAVVIVGYSKEHVYIHDPSGAYVSSTLGGLPKDQVILPGLANVAIPWHDWDKIFSGNFVYNWNHGNVSGIGFLVTDAFPNESMIITGKKPTPQTLSLQLLPKTYSLNISHQRKKYAGAPYNNAAVAYVWDGEKEDGWTFKHDEQFRPEVENPERSLCSSDRLGSVNAFVHNTGDTAVNVALEVRFGDETMPVVEANVGPGSNQAVALEVPKALDGTASIPVGEHELEVTLKKGGAVIDVSRMRIAVVPGIVSGVKARRTGKIVTVIWNPSSDAQRGAPNLEYRVYQSKERKNAPVELVGTAPKNSEAMEFELDEDEVDRPPYYAVLAYDPDTKVESIDGVFVKVEEVQELSPPNLTTRESWEVKNDKKDRMRFEIVWAPSSASEQELIAGYRVYQGKRKVKEVGPEATSVRFKAGDVKWPRDEIIRVTMATVGKDGTESPRTKKIVFHWNEYRKGKKKIK